MIFKRGRKRGSESPVEESTDDGLEEPAEASDDEADSPSEDEAAELAALEDIDWRSDGPYDITEVQSIEST